MESRYDVPKNMSLFLTDINNSLVKNKNKIVEINKPNQLVCDTVSLYKNNPIMTIENGLGLYEKDDDSFNVFLDVLEGDIIFVDSNQRIITFFRNNIQIKHLFLYDAD